MRLHPTTVALLGAALLVSASLARAEPPGDPPAGGREPRVAGLPVAEGVVRSLDLAAHRVTLEVDGAPLTLALDRNTLVYLPNGLSTVQELQPGTVVRAGRTDDLVARWIQVRSVPPGHGATPSSPGQGTGPGGGAAPPREGAALPAAPAPGGPAPAASSPGPG